MATNIILEKARERQAQRNRLGELYPELSKLSLQLLIKECGGQTNAAEIIRCFYGIRKCQGTISKAVHGDSSQTRQELRIAIDFLSFKEHAAEVVRQVVSHFGSFPVYHDILKYQDRYVLYVDSIMVAGVCHVVVINQKSETETLRLVDVEVA